jgi:hypothetical protein
MGISNGIISRIVELKMIAFVYPYTCIAIISTTLVFLYAIMLSLKPRNPKKLISFFHPYAAAGGGGERVLWLAVAAILLSEECGEDVEIVIYSGDKDLSGSAMIQAAFVSSAVYNQIKLCILLFACA